MELRSSVEQEALPTRTSSSLKLTTGFEAAAGPLPMSSVGLSLTRRCPAASSVAATARCPTDVGEGRSMKSPGALPPPVALCDGFCWVEPTTWPRTLVLPAETEVPTVDAMACAGVPVLFERGGD